MTTYLQLFLEFLKVGAFSFGGGYGMIAVIRDICLAKAWLTEEELLNFIAVAESTPGPIAVNMATFVGTSQGGLPGAVVATFGVVLPSFVIILLVSALFKNLLKLAGVQAALKGVRPVVIGLIVATGVTMTMKVVFGFSGLDNLMGAGAGVITVDFYGAVIFVLLVLSSALWKRIKKKNISPILLILVSAICGIILYK